MRVAINGYGRIGKNVLRAIFESGKDKQIEVVAINDMGKDLSVTAHLTKHDSVHGKFNGTVSHDMHHLIINQHPIKMYAQRDPAQLPWAELGVDIVFECTGLFTSKEKARAHIEAGAKKVIISAPGGDDMDATIVYGVNHHLLSQNMQVISNASCTTNCLAPVAKVLNDLVGIEGGLMTTIHAYTNDQFLTDSYHSDVYRTRSATMSMIPTKTGAAKALGLVLPELNGKLDGLAMRVPTPNVSIVDLTIVAHKQITKEEINNAMINAAKSPSLKGVLSVNHEPFVSIDFTHNAHSSIFDLTQTKVTGRLIKVFSWYDNEWGFSNRMLDVALAWHHSKK